jgi:hypothetical protein
MEGEAQLAKFNMVRLQRMTLSDLRRERAAATIFEQQYRIEEIRRSFKSRADLLRAAVKDRFKGWFAETLQSTEKVVTNPETLQKLRNLEESLRQEWTRDALNILVAKGNCQDLQLLREILDSGFIAFNEDDIRFLCSMRWRIGLLSTVTQ